MVHHQMLFWISVFQLEWQDHKDDVGPECPSFPASVEEMFYTSFVDTKAEGLLTILSPWLIPNLSNYFEVVNENEVLVKPGIYEITLSGLISNDTHRWYFYLQDENGSEIKALSFSFPQSNGKYAQFYQTTLLRFEEDTKLSVNTIIPCWCCSIKCRIF